VRGIARLRLERLHDHLLDLRVADSPGPARTRFVEQAVQPPIEKPPAPLAHRLMCDAKLLSHVRVVAPLGAGEDHPRSQRQRLRRRATTRPLLQSRTLCRRHQ